MVRKRTPRNRRRCRALLPALLLPLTLALVGAGGCSRPAERVAEKRINALLPQYLGPADRYSTRVRETTSGLLRGRLRRIHVDGVNVRMSDELTVDHLALDISDVSVDAKAQRIQSVGAIRVAATLGEANLNRYLRARRPDIAGLQVRLGAGEATVRATPEVADLFGVPLQVRGSLQPRPGGVLLDFVPGSARVSIVPVPGPVLRFVSERVNPCSGPAKRACPVPGRTDRTAAGRGRADRIGRSGHAACVGCGAAIGQIPRRRSGSLALAAPAIGWQKFQRSSKLLPNDAEREHGEQDLQAQIPMANRMSRTR
jgi:hypothetical protein